MQTALWLVLIVFGVAIAMLIRQRMRGWEARQRAEEERFASFMAGTTGAAKPKESSAAPEPAPSSSEGLAQQKLLFEAAHKAAEAGEPALAIQLYGRLLARYPATAFAAQARAAAQAQKKRLVKA